MSDLWKLDDYQVDVLQEVGNVGAGHAATALSMLLQDEVRMSVTSARLCPFAEISNVLGGPEELIVGVFLRIYGDICGNMFLLLSLVSAKKLLQKLMVTSEEMDDFTEMDVSALAEVGNILSGSYLNAICTLSSLKISQSVPAVAIDMAGAILDIGILMAGEVSDSAILINTSISQGGSNIDGHFFMLPDPGSTLPLFQALGC